VYQDRVPLELQAKMEKMVHQAPMEYLAAMDHPDNQQNKQLHQKHAKLAPMHQQDQRVIPVHVVPQDRQVHPDPHPMVEAVEHPEHRDLKARPANLVHPETRVNQVYPVKSSNSQAKLDHQALAVNLVHPETTVAMVPLVSQVAMVLQDRSATVAAQVHLAKTAYPVDRDPKASAACQALAITAHHRAQHPDTSKPCVYAVKQHCQYHHRCQKIVHIAMVGCCDDIMLSQPRLLYYFRFAFLLLTVLASSS